MSEPVNRVETAANSPQRARTAAGEVEAHKLSEQIAADRYLSAKKITNPFAALRIGTFVSPNALGDHSQGAH